MSDRAHQHSRDQFIIDRLSEGALWSDIVQQVQRQYGGSYEQLKKTVSRVACRMLGESGGLSIEERKITYLNVLKQIWDAHRRAKEDGSIRLELESLKIIADLIGGEAVLQELLKTTNLPVLNLRERPADAPIQEYQERTA